MGCECDSKTIWIQPAITSYRWWAYCLQSLRDGNNEYMRNTTVYRQYMTSLPSYDRHKTRCDAFGRRRRMPVFFIATGMPRLLLMHAVKPWLQRPLNWRSFFSISVCRIRKEGWVLKRSKCWHLPFTDVRHNRNLSLFGFTCITRCGAQTRPHRS